MTEELLDILEPGAELTEEQIDMLENDVELNAIVKDIAIAENVLSPTLPDIDKRLETFHKRIADKKRGKTNSRLRVIAITILATAAVFAGAFFIPLNIYNVDNKAINGNATSQVNPATDTPAKADRPHGSLESSIANTSSQASGAKVVTTSSATNHVANNTWRYAQLHADTMRVEVPVGDSYRLDLDDGTRIYLHPGTVIEYPAHFAANSREVRLKGEAYFVVAKDIKRPFTITTDRSVTTVLGTEFNLKSNGSEEEELMLVHGHVKFSGIHSREAVDVFPGQQVTITPFGNMAIEMADTMKYVSWRDGFIYYDHARLGDILNELGGRFNMKVSCYAPELLDLHMHFSFCKDQSIYDAIRHINRMKKVAASIDNKTIVVKDAD